MWTRRSFLRTTGVLGTAAITLKAKGLEHVLAASAAFEGQSPAEVARNEDYWREIQFAFTLDRTIINETIYNAVDAVECWVKDGTATAMNQFN